MYMFLHFSFTPLDSGAAGKRPYECDPTFNWRLLIAAISFHEEWGAGPFSDGTVVILRHGD
jgi:hypothetical protein